MNLRSEIDNIPTSNLEYSIYLITKIEPKKETKFKDPFQYRPGMENMTEEQISQAE